LGISPGVAYALYTEYGAEDCLQPVGPDIVQGLMGVIRGEDLIQFVTIEYAAHAQEVFDSLHIPKLTFQNVWEVLVAMLPHLST